MAVPAHDLRPLLESNGTAGQWRTAGPAPQLAAGQLDGSARDRRQAARSIPRLGAPARPASRRPAPPLPPRPRPPHLPPRPHLTPPPPPALPSLLPTPP